MAFIDTEECFVETLGDGSDLEAELLRGYACWLEGRLGALRDWTRAGETDRLSAEARSIAAYTSGSLAESVSRIALRLQLAATRRDTRAQARLCGQLRSRVDALRQAADVIEGCCIAARMAA